MAGTLVELIREGKDITTELTDIEKVKLAECEQIISRNLGAWFETGKAWAYIRDNRLYRETHKTFEKYFKDKWDIGKSKAYYEIAGYETVCLLESKMSTIVDKNNSDDEKILPVNEAQARPLTKLKNPDDQVKAWSLVLERLNGGKKLTASLINNAVKEVRGEVKKKKIVDSKKQVDSTQLVSTLFKKQYQVMLDIISEEQNSEWKTTSKKEAVKWLKTLVKIAESDD